MGQQKACDFFFHTLGVSVPSGEESLPGDCAVKSLRQQLDFIWWKVCESLWISFPVEAKDEINLQILKDVSSGVAHTALTVFLHSQLHTYLWLFSPLSSPLSIWRPLHGGQIWWWNMLRPSCVSIRPRWMQLLKFSHLTAGTVSLSSSCSMTFWGWTVSVWLFKKVYSDVSMDPGVVVFDWWSDFARAGGLKGVI